MFVFPAIVNAYGKSYSLAQLLSSGYASFDNNGVRPTIAFDIARYIQPLRCKSYASKSLDIVSLFVQISVTGPGIPGIDSVRGGFIGGVYTKYRSFLVPKYPEMVVNDRYYESDEESESEEQEGEKTREEYADQRTSYRRNYSKKPKTIKTTLPPAGNKKDNAYYSFSLP